MKRIAFALILSCLSEFSFSQSSPTKPIGVDLGTPTNISQLNIEAQNIQLSVNTIPDEAPIDLKPYTKELEKAAKRGVVDAQRDLGICYLYGSGIKIDEKKAFEWLCQAAVTDATAQYYIGLMFEKGRVDLTADKKGYYKNLLRILNNVEQREAREMPSRLWYTKSASGDCDLAMIRLARISRANRNEESAIHYFKLAADHGNSEGQREYQAFVDRLSASGITIRDNDLIVSSNVGTQEYVEDKHERIIILNSVSSIGYGAFEWANAKEIIFQDGDNLLTIETAAFGFGNRRDVPIKEIIFNRPVHIKSQAFHCCCPDLLVFNKDVEFIGEDAFGDDKGVKKVVFKKVPKKIECRWHHNFIKGDKNGYLNCDEIEIPTGTEAAFVSLGFDNKKLFEEVGNSLSLSIKLEKPNSILSVLKPNELLSIDSLTIVGFMYETDLKILENCKNMRYLDLSRTYITYSPEKVKADRENQKYMAALFAFMGEVADAKFNNYEMGVMNHAYVKGFAKLMEQSFNVKEADPGCVIPADAFKKMNRLEEVILPQRTSSIGNRAFHSCHALKNVMLPPYLQTIGTGAFAYCTSLTKMDFPSTLTDIGLYAREGFAADTGDGSLTFTALEKIDFSKCSFQPNSATDMSWTYVFKGCDNLKEIGLPSGVSNIDLRANTNDQAMTFYVPASVKVLQINLKKSATLHFASPTPPKMGFYGTGFNNCTFYIPKGSTTAYYAAYGSTNNYIEE